MVGNAKKNHFSSANFETLTVICFNMCIYANLFPIDANTKQPI